MVSWFFGVYLGFRGPLPARLMLQGNYVRVFLGCCWKMDKYRTGCKSPHETCDMLNVGNRTPERKHKNSIGDPFPEGNFGLGNPQLYRYGRRDKTLKPQGFERKESKGWSLPQHGQANSTVPLETGLYGLACRLLSFERNLRAT